MSVACFRISLRGEGLCQKVERGYHDCGCSLERNHRLVIGLLDWDLRLRRARLGVGLRVRDEAEDDAAEEVGQTEV